MPSEAADFDVGQFVGRRLKDCPVVVNRDEIGPVGGRAAGGRDRRMLERFAEVREDLPDRAWIGDEGDEWASPSRPGRAVKPKSSPRKMVRPLAQS
jgi:hypothetical protein